MRYLATDVYDALKARGCEFEGDLATGNDGDQGWLGPGCQIFLLPAPFVEDGRHWLDADVVDEIVKDRWLGFSLSDVLKRYP